MKNSECKKWCLYSQVIGGCMYGYNPYDCETPKAPSQRYYDEYVDVLDDWVKNG